MHRLRNSMFHEEERKRGYTISLGSVLPEILQEQCDDVKIMFLWDFLIKHINICPVNVDVAKAAWLEESAARQRCKQ